MVKESKSPNARARKRLGTPAYTATLAAFALLLTGCGGAVSEQAGADEDPFKIGLIAPVTGPVVPEGLALERGFELGIEKINENGGVLGQPVEFVMVDDEADVAQSTQLAQRLVDQDEVDFLFGTVPGDTAGAVAQVSQNSQVPFATAIMGDAPYCGDYFFSFGEPDQSMLEHIVPRMMEEYGDNVALLGNDYVFPREYQEKARGMIEDAGGTVVVEDYSPLGTSDWQPIVQGLSSEKPDWVLSAVVGGDAVALITQIDQSGLFEDMGFSGISLIQEFYPSLDPRTDSMLLSGRYSDVLENEANEEFVENYREAYDFQDPIPSVAANAYEGVQAVARAVEAAGSTDGDAIAQELAQTTVENGVFGSGRFTDDHRFITDMYMFEIQPGGEYRPVEDLGALDTLPPNNSCS